MDLHGLVVGPSSSAEPLGQRLLLFRARIKADLLHSPHYRCLLCSGTSMELQQRIRQLTASIEQKKEPLLRFDYLGAETVERLAIECRKAIASENPQSRLFTAVGSLQSMPLPTGCFACILQRLPTLLRIGVRSSNFHGTKYLRKPRFKRCLLDTNLVGRVLLGKSGLRLPDILFTAVTDSVIVLCSVQVKTRIKRLAASKFIDAIRSTSRDWFLRGKSQDVKQHTKLQSLWESQLQQLPRGKSVCHLRFVVSWAGFTQAQVDLINSFNAKNPEQLILLVQPALTAVGDFIYGTRCNKFLSSTLGKHTKTRASKSKKNTLATEDLVMALLPQEMAWMGSPMAEEEEDSEEEENRGKDRAPAAKRPKRED
ncbi:hypothetical protein QOT17_012600 [Balamuthia mandrillaris]